MSEDFEFNDKWPQIDRVLSQLKRLNELSDEELQAGIQKLNRKTDK